MNPLTAFIASFLCSSQLAAAGKVTLFDQEIDLDLSRAFAKVSPGVFVAQSDSTLTPAEEQCLKEVQDLENDSGLVSAVNDLENCPMQEDQMGSYEIKLTMDYSSCSQVGNFQLACTTAGGKVDSISSISVECEAYTYGQTVKVNVYAKNVPACLGESCEGSFSEFTEDKEVQQELANEIEALLANEGISSNCVVGISSPASAVIVSKLALVGGLIALVANAL